MYRGTWLLVGIPLLVAAFSVTRPDPLPQTPLPPAFDRVSALTLATDLARSYPDRSPGSANAAAVAQWVVDRLGPYGVRARRQPFTATIAGRGRVRLANVVASVPGRSTDAIVVMAHRDNAGTSPGANDNASGTAALIELARLYATVPGGAPRAAPYTLVFLSTDGGSFGGLGAARFAGDPVYRDRIVAVINLDAIAGRGPARLQIAGDEPRSPAPALVETAAVRLLEQTGARPARPSALRQLVDLAFPFSLYEQAPFVALGIPALTITTGGDRPSPSFGDAPETLAGARLAQIGRAAESLVGSLEAGLELESGGAGYVYFGPRMVQGWSLQLVLVAALVPFLAAVVDLFARCRRRGIALAPALRSLRRRAGFWLAAGAVFLLLKRAGAWPDGDSRPPAPADPGSGDWALPAVALAGVLVGGAWLLARERLLPRRPTRPDEALAGYAAALLALGALALVVVPLNAYALLFVLPSLHAWLWLPQVQTRRTWMSLALLGAGCAGPALLLASFAWRFGLGGDAPWYLLTLASVGYVELASIALALAWATVAAQLAALASGRYAPYAAATEHAPRGFLRRARRALGTGKREGAEPPGDAAEL